MAILVTQPSDLFPEVKLLTADYHTDQRGEFRELYHSSVYTAHGLPLFVQDNLSWSNGNVLRGLHYQWPNLQGKLVIPIQGYIRDVVVDVRCDSPTFGQAAVFSLMSHRSQQLYVPPGFAHGFHTCAGPCLVYYKCTQHYAPDAQRGVRWDDPKWAKIWLPEGRKSGQFMPTPFLSSQDENWSLFEDIPLHNFPTKADCQ